MALITTFYKNLVELSNLKTGIYQSRNKYLFEISSYSLIAYLTPLFLFHSQFLLGTIVNSMLITGALYTRGKSLLPLIFLPSLGVLTKGVLFGPLTIYLLFMLPFIWIGNTILIFSVKFFHLKHKKHYLKGIFYGSALKAAFLFISALVLYNLGVIPVAFLTAFGIMQFVTAISAGLIIFPINIWRLKVEKSC
ncbi:MAG TPA: hypothetical protein ENF39_00140 [Candidatus Aenigmarchaeota archaeon]|nr:MAG: hypothetical protein DRP14_00435 [Candidatus Aenigmarchaeota archaeon]HDI06401.1 hypothetical protein [Candidatus Aenigmarchaeota archaeon]